MTESTPPPAAPARQPRAPTLLDSLLPVVVLIGLLALTIWLYGIDATNGPLQACRTRWAAGRGPRDARGPPDRRA